MEGEESEMPAPGRSATGRAVALARLLHQDCNRLLELYRERESFLSEHTPEGDRLVTLSLSSDDLTTADRVCHLHSALRKCLGLLECLIVREEEVGEEGEYETARKNVRVRLGHLLHSTGALLANGEGAAQHSPDHDCSEGTDEVDTGSFGVKLWTYRVLLELIHWTESASRTLHVFHSEREGPQAQQEL